MHQRKLVPQPEDQRPLPHQHPQGAGVLGQGRQLGESSQGEVGQGQRAVGGDHRAGDTLKQESGGAQHSA